jgi:hypothetical protein
MNTAPATNKGDDFLAQKGFKRAKNDRAWDWVYDVSSNVRNYISAPAVLMPMLRDERLIAAVQEQNNTGRLADLITRLTSDSQLFVTRYHTTKEKHSARRGNSADPDDLMKSIMVGQEYMRFMSSYESIIMPTIQEILGIMDKAGLDTTNIRATTNRELVYNLYQSSPSPT